MWRSSLAANRDLPARPLDFDRRDERIVQSVRRLAMTVARMFSAPGAFVALYEKDELLQIMACFGIDLAAQPESGFLSPALVFPGKSLIVPDTDLEPAFANDVWVTNAGIRFFAGAPLIDTSGHPVGLLCIVDRAPRAFANGHIKLLHDMASIGVSELSTHHRLRVQEQALQEAQARVSRVEALYERMTAGLPIPLFAVDATCRVLNWNPACAETLGYSQDEVLGQPITPLLAEDAVTGGFDTIVQRVFNRRRISGLDLKMRTRAGSIRRLSCRLLPVYDALGQIEACAFMAADITALQRLEQANRELDAGNHLLAGLTSACSFALTQEADGTCWLQRASSAFGRVTGIRFDTSQPLRWTDMVHPDDAGPMLAAYQALSLQQSDTVCVRLRIPDAGHRRMQHAVQLVEHDPATGARRYLGVLRIDKTGWPPPAVDLLDSSILSIMSHEIRTPLTSILGFAELLGAQEDATHRRFAALIEKSAGRLFDTLGALLDLSQQEDHLLAFEPTLSDFGAHVAEVATPFREDAIARGLLWHFHAPAEPVMASIDPEASTRVLKQILSNALKFTSLGAIQIIVASTEDAVTLIVQDTGVGISAEFFPHLFREFQQECTGITRPFEGAGLGLAIAKRLVDAMGGVIALESEKGVGTTVTLRYTRAA
ncbi:MAG: ATP-binding protein [Rhodothermales bacterium]|nr:ATP-binding protein [Rhodothermales bacterium]